MMNTRRQFLIQSATVFGTAAAFPVMAQSVDQPVSPPPDDPARPRLELARVKAFVQAGHSDLPKVKAMLEEEPALINASWDWGNGDWETALEGASHMARMDIVAFLLRNGARANLFSMAVLGNVEAVNAMIQAEPAFFNTRGPHFLTLLYHAALSGRVDLTEMIAAHLGDDRGQHFNQALRGAAQFGTAEMVEWLLTNGVTNVNELNFWNETPLDISLKRGDEAIAELLKKKGGVRSSP